MSLPGRNGWRPEEGDQPISTIFLLVVALIKLVTMVTFISYFREQTTPAKNRARGVLKGVILGGIHKSISDTSLHPHNTSTLPFQMNTRTNVFRSSVTFCTPTNNEWFVIFSENVKIHFFKWIFLGGPGRYKFKANCNVLTIYVDNNLSQR